jgi:uncharacterized protein (TIGR00369 family)
MGRASNDDESQDDIDRRSRRWVDTFNSFKDTPLGDLPVPPFTKWLNGQLISAERGDISIRITTRPEMANPTGLLHGGMQAGILDDTMGVMCATLGYKGFLISLDMNVNYLGKVPIGNDVIARAHVVREGKTIVHIEAELRDDAGAIVATASSNCLITNFEPDYNKGQK